MEINNVTIGPGDQENLNNNNNLDNLDTIPQYNSEFPDNMNSTLTLDNLENMNPLRVAPWSSDFNTCHTIENLNATFQIELNRDIQNMINIHQDMVQLLNDRFTTEINEEDEEIIEHKKRIEGGMKSFELLTKDFQAQQKKTLLAEEEFKKALEETSKDTEKIKEFTAFMIQLDSKYDDPEIKNLNQSMIDISEKIKKNSRCEELKKEYHKQIYVMKYYLHHFIKKINSGNLGSTCSLCLTRCVDTFMDPCGHTACSACIEELKGRGSEYNINCFLCRKVVNKFHKLYFT